MENSSTYNPFSKLYDGGDSFIPFEGTTIILKDKSSGGVMLPCKHLKIRETSSEESLVIVVASF